MRRVMESESREFGMVMPGTAQGGMAEYGTMLRVVDLRLQDDGRSVVETVGTTRFRILEHGQLDGYMVGRVERVEDIPSEAESALEAAAMARVGPGITPEPSTERLVAICHEFIELLRSGSAPWLVQRLNNTYGPPPTVVSDFSFWMAAVLPIDESEKVRWICRGPTDLPGPPAEGHELASAPSTSCVGSCPIALMSRSRALDRADAFIMVYVGARPTALTTRQGSPDVQSLDRVRPLV